MRLPVGQLRCDGGTVMSPARDEAYDFVIVGSGGASTCASLPCKTLGKRTLIVERRAAIEAAIRRTFG